jgi:hypothetical protein
LISAKNSVIAAALRITVQVNHAILDIRWGTKIAIINTRAALHFAISHATICARHAAFGTRWGVCCGRFATVWVWASRVAPVANAIAANIRVVRACRFARERAGHTLGAAQGSAHISARQTWVTSCLIVTAIIQKIRNSACRSSARAIRISHRTSATTGAGAGAACSWRCSGRSARRAARTCAG